MFVMVDVSMLEKNIARENARTTAAILAANLNALCQME